MIADAFPWAANRDGSQDVPSASLVMVGAIVAAVDGIPDELLPLGAERTRFATAVAAVRIAAQHWTSNSGTLSQLPKLGNLSAVSGHPLAVVHDILCELPDEAPATAESELPFIADARIRHSIRTDMSNADRALGNGEWKAATVLAGAVIEALLLWAITQRSAADVEAAAKAWELAASSQSVPFSQSVRSKAPDEWHIREYVAMAFHLMEITKGTRDASLLAGNFRNLIHPGRVLRLGTEASRGDAHVAIGAMRKVSDDIAARHSR